MIYILENICDFTWKHTNLENYNFIWIFRNNKNEDRFFKAKRNFDFIRDTSNDDDDDTDEDEDDFEE